jgi:1-deoxy-D-xylulose-5-phosphate reductoisomerase
MVKKIAVLGSTGSVGCQTLRIIDAYPDRFRLVALSANRDVGLLARQARRFRPSQVVVADQSLYRELKEELSDSKVEVLAGNEALCQMPESSGAELAINAIVGFAGLKPALSALAAGVSLALANKESLVAGGHLVMPLAEKSGTHIIPVDSEHSAVFQCLQGQDRSALERIVLTASGGPFYGLTAEKLHEVTPEQALNHPNWRMGAKITVDSATLMNKGLEVIEARWLFNLPYERIRVVIHRESIIHSLVEFRDGATLAQMGAPDMMVPIQYALTYPERLPSGAPRVEWARLGALNFAAPDTLNFPALELAYRAGRTAGSMPAVLSAANEVAVSLFLERRIDFLAIPSIIEAVMNKHKVVLNPGIEELVAADHEARANALAAAERKRL